MEEPKVPSASSHADAVVGRSPTRALVTEVPSQAHDAHIEKLLVSQLKLLNAIEALQFRIDCLPERLKSDNALVRHHSPGDIAIYPEGDIANGAAPKTQQGSEACGINRLAVENPMRSVSIHHAPSSGADPGSSNVRPYSNIAASRQIEWHPLFAEHSHLEPEELEEIAHDWAVVGVSARRKQSMALMSSHTMALASDSVRRLPLHPLALFPTIVDCLSVVMLLVDAIMVPVIVAWEVPADVWLLIVSAIMIAFWTCDMILKFCTGFIEHACVVMSRKAIIKRYLKKTFIFDFSLILLDSIDLVRSITSYVSPSSTSSQSRTLNLFKLMRLTKMIRMARLSTRMGNRSAALGVWMVRWYGAMSQAARYITFAGVLVRLTFAIFFLGHFLACIWYFMLQKATPEDAKDRSWIALIPEMDDRQMYLYAVYWSLTTLFSGSSFLHPSQTWEIVYTTLLVLVGALFVTSITSTLAAVLVEVQLAWVEMKNKLSSMTEFLDQKHMPAPVIVTTLEELAQHMSEKRSSVSEADVQVQLALLSHNVRALLRYEQYHGKFMKLQIIQLIHVLHPGIIQELSDAATFQIVKPGEEIFDVDCGMHQAMLVSVGEANYTPWRRRTNMAGAVSSYDYESADEVPGGTWLCEVALLVTWRTLGSLEAKRTCEMLVLSVDTFTKAVIRIPAMLAVVGSYSVEVAKCLTSGEGERTRNDINLGIDTDIIVRNMSTLVRYRLISAPRLGRLRHLQGSFSIHARRKAWSHLELDMNHGRCHITTDEEGHELRVVTLALLWLEDEDGRLCMELGRQKKASNFEMEPHFGLPGKTVEGDETPVTAIQKWLEDQFVDLASQICIPDRPDEPVIEYARSSTYGIRTKYIKYYVRACLAGSITVAPELAGVPFMQRLSTTKSQSVSGYALGSMGSQANLKVSAWEAFAVRSKDGSYMMCEFINKHTFDHRWKSREAEIPVLKAVLARLSFEAVDSLSRSWRVLRTDECQDIAADDAIADAPIADEAFSWSKNSSSEHGNAIMLHF